MPCRGVRAEDGRKFQTGSGTWIRLAGAGGLEGAVRNVARAPGRESHTGALAGWVLVPVRSRTALAALPPGVSAGALAGRSLVWVSPRAAADSLLASQCGGILHATRENG